MGRLFNYRARNSMSHFTSWSESLGLAVGPFFVSPQAVRRDLVNVCPPVNTGSNYI